MAEFTKERAGGPKPILTIPRGGGRSTDYTPKVIEIYLEIGRKPAGCVVCSKPIPPGSSRLKVLARFPTEWISPEPDRAHPVTTQTYYVHPGCLTDRVKPEIIRFGSDCYDCGALPPVSGKPTGFDEHPYRCFTVSKFAPGRLCIGCTRKRHWRQCLTCEIYFPPWMISRVVSQIPKPTDLDPFAIEPDFANGTDVCPFCARRYRLTTEEEAAEKKSEFDRLRQDILEQGVYGAGNS